MRIIQHVQLLPHDSSDESVQEDEILVVGVLAHIVGAHTILAVIVEVVSGEVVRAILWFQAGVVGSFVTKATSYLLELFFNHYAFLDPRVQFFMGILQNNLFLADFTVLGQGCK